MGFFPLGSANFIEDSLLTFRNPFLFNYLAGHTMKFILLAALLVTLCPVAAQEQADGARPTPATKLEAFSAKKGVVLIKGYTTLGSVSGMGRVAIDVREFRDASNPKSAQYGVVFEVKEAGRLERESSSFVDEDEIDSLIKGLEYVSKIGKGVTTLSNFEAQYRTKGELALVVFSDSNGAISLAVSSGRIGKTSAYLKLEDTERIRALLGEAKQAIALAKSSAK